MKTNFPSHLSDTALVAAVMRLAGGEREATVQLITHLAELDRRRLYLPAGYSSLYAYCRAVLRLSEPEAYIRMKAARAVRRFPGVLEMLLDGSLNLTTLRLLIPHLNASTHETLLAAAAGKSKRDVQELLARLFPQLDVLASVRKLPARPAMCEVVVPTAREQLDADSSRTLPCAPAPNLPPLGTRGDTVPPVLPTPSERPLSAPAPAAPPQHRPLVTPLAPDRYQITFTASTETRDRLEFARDLLRHAVPDGDPAAIIDRALTALLRELAQKKFAETTQARASRGTLKRSRYIPSRVKREVWVRDLGRCAFRAADGRRCGERAFVEFHHHDEPYGIGGPPTVANLQLRCKAHNQYEADLFYGAWNQDAVVKETGAAYGAASARNWVRTQLRAGHSTSTAWPDRQGSGAGRLRERMTGRDRGALVRAFSSA